MIKFVESKSRLARSATPGRDLDLFVSNGSRYTESTKSTSIWIIDIDNLVFKDIVIDLYQLNPIKFFIIAQG